MNHYSNKDYGGRIGPRVESDIWSAIAERVGSGQRFAESSRVGSQKSDPWTTLVLSHRQMYLTNHVRPTFNMLPGWAIAHPAVSRRAEFFWV